MQISIPRLGAAIALLNASYSRRMTTQTWLALSEAEAMREVRKRSALIQTADSIIVTPEKPLILRGISHQVTCTVILSGGQARDVQWRTQAGQPDTLTPAVRKLLSDIDEPLRKIVSERLTDLISEEFEAFVVALRKEAEPLLITAKSLLDAARQLELELQTKMAA